MSEYDATALVEEVRERGSLPANDVRFTSAKILTAATKELREGVAPLLVETRAEHLVYEHSVSATSGTAAYRMPSRAIGGSLRDVVWVDSSSNAHPPLRQLSSDEPAALQGHQGTPTAYYLRNYHVVLVPTPNVSGTVRMPYYARPNQLVATSAVVEILTASNSGTAWTLTYAGTPPAGLNTNGATVPVDVVRATPGFETLAEAADCLCTELSPGQWQYQLTASETLAEGDYLCVAGQSPVPQCPVELHGLLAVRTARRLLKAAGDAGWEALSVDVEELEHKARGVLSPRVAGDTQQAGGSIGSNGLVAGLAGC